MSRTEPTEHEQVALTVECPTCGVVPGRWCRSESAFRGGWKQFLHIAREAHRA